MNSNFACERCGSHNARWARKLSSERWVCANCYSELPFDNDNPDPSKRNLVVDDMQTGVPTKRKIVVRW